jgi:general secretion pathway protein J
MMRRDAGFTLVELLVALALLALLSTLLAAGLRFSRNAVLTGEAGTERLLSAERALEIVRRQLQQADPLPLAATGDRPPVAFAGDGTSIVFIAPPAAYLAPDGEQIEWLQIEPNGGRLVLRFRPLDRTRDTWPPRLDPAEFQSVVLLDGISAAQFSYFGRTQPSDVAQWWQKWDTLPTLPSLIRLALASGGTNWPDLVVAPRIGQPPNAALLPDALCRRGSGPLCNF